MKSAYASYKEWWIEYKAVGYRERGFEPRIHWPNIEDTFAVYWCSLNAYERYEILEDWLLAK